MQSVKVLFGVSVGIALAAGCGGSTSGNSSGDDGGGSSGGDASASSSGSGGGSGSSSSSGGSSGGSGSGSSSGSSSGSGGGDAGGAGPVPCGMTTCSPPQICCTAGSRDDAGVHVTQSCTDPSSCQGAAVGCTADTCTGGDVCCGSLGSAGGASTQCESSCGMGQGQLCDPMNPNCPMGEDCRSFGMGMFALHICVPGVTRDH